MPTPKTRLIVALALACGLAGQAQAQAQNPYDPASRSRDSTARKEAETRYAAPAERPQPFFVMPKRDEPPPNTMMPGISPEAKRNFIRSMNMFNPLSIREMMNLMVDKVQAKDGLSFDEVVDTLKRRANERNFKVVGHNQMWKDVQAITNQPTPRVEFFSLCDAMVGRQVLDYSLEAVAFLPCRVAVVEDATKKIWLVTQDWDMLWMDLSPNPNTADDKLYKEAQRIRQILSEIMNAAALGEF